MSIKQSPNPVQDRDGHVLKYPVMKTSGFRTAWNEGPFFEIVAVVIDELLGGAPAGFKLNETTIFRLAPAKTKTRISILRVPSYGFPHNKVVRPEMAIFCI